MNITYKEAAAASENDSGAPNLIVLLGEKRQFFAAIAVSRPAYVL